MRNLIERLEKKPVDEAKQPYWKKPRDEQEVENADLHEAVAKACRDVMKVMSTLHQVVAKAADKTGEGTFLETREKLWKVDVIELMKQVATDHTRWAKGLQSVIKTREV
jgi:hypothetical protein